MAKPNATKRSKAVTVRIPHEVLAAVDAEAEALEMSRSEAVTRRLRRSFTRVLERSNLEQDSSIAAGDIADLIEDMP